MTVLCCSFEQIQMILTCIKKLTKTDDSAAFVFWLYTQSRCPPQMALASLFQRLLRASYLACTDKQATII